MRLNPINAKGFIAWREWFYMKKFYWRWFFRTFWNKSKFENFEVFNEIHIKPRKKGTLISGLKIHEGGSVVIK